MKWFHSLTSQSRATFHQDIARFAKSLCVGEKIGNHFRNGTAFCSSDRLSSPYRGRRLLRNGRSEEGRCLMTGCVRSMARPVYGLKILSRKKLDLWLCWRVVYQNVGKSLQYLFIVSSFGEKIQCICFGWWLLTRCSGTVCNWRLIASVMSAFEFWPKHWLGLRISISFSSLLPLLLLRRRKKMKIRSTTTLIVKDELPKVFFEWGGGEGRGRVG